MKKLFTAFLLVCVGSQINAQTTTIETLDSLTDISSYSDGSFTGVNSIVWDYVESRTHEDYEIDGQSIMLRRLSDNSKISTTSIPGGISSFSVDLKKGFTGGGNRQVEIFVNGGSIGTSVAFDDTLVHNLSITGLTTSGNFDLEVRNITGKQVMVDNITWTSYTSTSTTPEISFNNSADTVEIDAFASELPMTYDFPYSFSNFVIGTDGLVKYGYINASGVLTFDTTTTGSFSLDLTEFGTHTVAVGFTDLLGIPTTTQDTIVIVLNEIPIADVATVADLRAQTEGNYYRLTGEAVITYLQDFRSQKYIQDATAGILIDDSDGIITGTFNVYDGLTGLTGELTSYNGVKQFKPLLDMTMASSTGNTVTPVVVTANDLNTNIDDYESELITIETATVTGDTNVFVNGNNYTITDASGSSVFRTQFYGVDYIGTEIPGASHYTGIAIRYNSTAQLVSRDLMDICEIDYTVGSVDFAAELNSTDQSEYTVTFTVPSDFASYSWNFGDGSMESTDQSPTHEYSTNGTYTVELTVTNHCGIDKTVNATVSVEGVGVEEHTAFTMFPVPAKNVLNVDFANDTEKVISIYNTLGVKVAVKNVTSNATVNTSNFSSGIYVMVVTEGEKATTKRFVVK